MTQLKMPDRLQRGDLLPEVHTQVPGPRSLQFSQDLQEFEPPGINTLYGGQPNILWSEALGANVLDVDGNRYLDLTSGFGVAAVGHRHPRILSAIQEQSQRLLLGLGDASGHPLRIEVARRLRDLAPIDETQTYFAISGSDAVEIALKTALLKTLKPGVLSFEPSYHGLTLGALAATTRPAFRKPFEEHLHRHSTRLPFGCDPLLVRQQFRANPAIGCLLLEPIVGREGVLIPPTGWLTELRELCDEYAVLLIVDEIFTGFGRTGKLFAVDHESVRPDLLCCGKALGGGLPIGAVLGSKTLLRSWQTSGEALHTATFVAHPLACAAALAALDLIDELNLPARARHLGQTLLRRLSLWPKRFTCLSRARGRGLLWGLEMHGPRAAALLSSHCRERGLLVLAGGPEGRVVQLVPPLTVTEEQLEIALEILEGSLRFVDQTLFSEAAASQEMTESQEP